MKKSIQALTLTGLAMTLSLSAFAKDDAGRFPISPMVEIGAGYEYQVIEASTPCAVKCGGSKSISDDKRSDGILHFGFAGILASQLTPENPSGLYNFAFLPISMDLDIGSEGAGDKFGRV